MAHPRRVTGLDRVDRRGGCKHRVGLDQMGLALVRGDGEILEGDGSLEERLLILRCPAEVERGPLDRLCSEELAERGDVGALDGTDDPHRARGFPGERAEPLRLGVERRLEVLEREGIVENRDVALRHCGPSRGRKPAEYRSRTGSGGEEPRTWDARGRFLQGAVAIELIEAEVEL